MGIVNGEGYTLALTVYEEGLGITAVTGVQVNVSLPSVLTSVNTGGVGGLSIEGLATSSYGELVPTVGMTVQMVDGAGDVQIEIASVKTGQVVAERLFHNVKTPGYVGKPADFSKKGVFYLYKVSDSVTPHWELRFEAASSTTTMDVTLMGLSGPIIMGVQGGAFTPLVGGPGGGNSVAGLQRISGTCAGSCTWQFLPTTPTDPSASAFSIQVGFGTADFIFSNPPLYIGPSSKQAAYNPTVLGDETAGKVSMVWDKKNLGGTGYVSSGDYLVRVSATGMGGVGYVEVTRSIHVKTPYNVFYAIDSGSQGGESQTSPFVKIWTPMGRGQGGGPTSITIDPYTALDTLTILATVSKTSTLRAVVRDADGKLVHTIADGKFIHPTGTTAPQKVIWEGMRSGTLGPVVATPGKYVLNVVFQPVDGSASRLLSVPVLLQDSGVGKVAMTDFLDLAGKTVTLNKEALPFVQGETGFQWSAMASGKLYPPVDFTYSVQVQNAIQRVIAYPYIPFVTVAHQWFETVRVLPDMVFHTTFVRFGYALGDGWKKEIEFHRKPIFSQEHRFTTSNSSLKGTYKESFHCPNPDYGKKPDVDIEDMRVVVVIRSPDGTPMDTLPTLS